MIYKTLLTVVSTAGLTLGVPVQAAGLDKSGSVFTGNTLLVAEGPAGNMPRTPTPPQSSTTRPSSQPHTAPNGGAQMPSVPSNDQSKKGVDNSTPDLNAREGGPAPGGRKVSGDGPVGGVQGDGVQAKNNVVGRTLPGHPPMVANQVGGTGSARRYQAESSYNLDNKIFSQIQSSDKPVTLAIVNDPALGQLTVGCHGAKLSCTVTDSSGDSVMFDMERTADTAAKKSGGGIFHSIGQALHNVTVKLDATFVAGIPLVVHVSVETGPQRGDGGGSGPTGSGSGGSGSGGNNVIDNDPRCSDGSTKC